MKILLIEDDAPIRQVVKRGIEESDIYTVETAADGISGLNMAIEENYAAIILDLMLPGMDGWHICEELRARRINTPILMLTARDTIPDRVKGFDAGADDYLTKPFDFDELMARIRALIRRDRAFKGRVLRVAHLEIDTSTHQVFSHGDEVSLTQREYMLLEALAANEGRTLTREAIQYSVWNNDDSTSNTVDVYIRLLRKKIGTDNNAKLIHTVHGIGYVLKRPEQNE
jgi:two-component system copper resistance phosphate regulon response regulator CusR